jgi:molecular chaperone DnaK
MTHYIGIDLGTTNSSISSFDGENVKTWKNLEQKEIMSSVIFVDKYGAHYYGEKARMRKKDSPERILEGFKRLIGTNHKWILNYNNKDEKYDKEYTPEICSSYILKELFKNLPEEIRNSEDIAVVITVPSSFDQKQNNATLEAAKKAGFERVLLLKEPTAAAICASKDLKEDVKFIIYDLGGGTFDVTLVEIINGKINELANGGRPSCGGRDLDRLIKHKIVIPWLNENYSLPENFENKSEYKKLLGHVSYLIEEAKIELSQNETSLISGETNVYDEKGEEIYFDLEIDRETCNKLFDEIIDSTIDSVLDTIKKADLHKEFFDKIVFIGGPTNYKPLRDKITKVLEIEGSIDINPMTAVSEGASIYAETLDWSSGEHHKKSIRGEIKSEKELELSFEYIARPSKKKSKVIVKIKNDVTNYNFCIKSIDSGWASGNMQLINGMETFIPLSKKGKNKFVVEVTDNYGRLIKLENNTIEIIYAFADIAILASHSIGIEVLEKEGFKSTRLEYIVKEGDNLPIKGQKKFRTTEAVKSNDKNSIKFNLWEGDIKKPVTDNNHIGCMYIKGSDFDNGVIKNGDEIICNYEINESGGIKLNLHVSSIEEDFYKDFDRDSYSRKEGELDIKNAPNKLSEVAEEVYDRLNVLYEQIIKSDSNHASETKNKILKLKDKAERIIDINDGIHDEEEIKKSSDELIQLKKEIYEITNDNKIVIQKQQLKIAEDCFSEIKDKMEDYDKMRIEDLINFANTKIGENDDEFDNIIYEINGNLFGMTFKYMDIFVEEVFRDIINKSGNYSNNARYNELIRDGMKCLREKDYNSLREIVIKLYNLIGKPLDMNMRANIIKT